MQTCIVSWYTRYTSQSEYQLPPSGYGYSEARMVVLRKIKAFLTRKSTTPVHIALGLLIALAYPHFPALAITLFILFGVFELWQSIAFWYFFSRRPNINYSRYNDEGYMDFWEAFVGVAIGLTILLAKLWIIT